MISLKLHKLLQWLERELCAVLAIGIVGLGSLWAQAGTSGTSTLSVTVLPPGGEVTSVSSPNGGESWTIGTSQNITWTATFTITDVKIELQRSVGGSWETIVESTTNDGTYPWTVAGSATAAASIRISKVGDPSINDVSDAVFSLVAAVVPQPPGGGGGGGIITYEPQPILPTLPTTIWKAGDYRARILKQTYAVTLLPGEQGTIRVDVVNVGNAVWYGTGTSNPVRLGVVGDRPSTLSSSEWIKFNRAAVIESANGLGVVDARGVGWFDLKIEAPLSPGVYSTQFAMVAEYVTWLPNTKVNVKVTVRTGASTGQSIAKKAPAKTTPTVPSVIKESPTQKTGWLVTVWRWVISKAVAAVKAMSIH